jgi:hypothetical protein
MFLQVICCAEILLYQKLARFQQSANVCPSDHPLSEDQYKNRRLLLVIVKLTHISRDYSTSCSDITRLAVPEVPAVPMPTCCSVSFRTAHRVQSSAVPSRAHI